MKKNCTGKRLIIKKILSQSNKKAKHITANSKGIIIPNSKSVPVFNREGNKLKLVGYSKEGEVVNGYETDFLLACGKTFKLLNFEKNKFIPMEHLITEVKSSIMSEEIPEELLNAEGEMSKLEAKLINNRNMLIGSSIGLATGLIVGNIYKSAKFPIIIAGLGLGAYLGIITNEKEKNALKEILNRHKAPSFEEAMVKIKELQSKSEDKKTLSESEITDIKSRFDSFTKVQKSILMEVMDIVGQSFSQQAVDRDVFIKDNVEKLVGKYKKDDINYVSYKFQDMYKK